VAGLPVREEAPSQFKPDLRREALANVATSEWVMAMAVRATIYIADSRNMVELDYEFILLFKKPGNTDEPIAA
jgi:hypothetical protein